MASGKKQLKISTNNSSGMFILGHTQSNLIRDRAMLCGTPPSQAAQTKQWMDMRSSIENLPGASSCRMRKSEKENRDTNQFIRFTATSDQRKDLGLVPPEKIR